MRLCIDDNDEEAVKLEQEMEDVDVKASSGRSAVTASAMAASYNDQIRPLLDAVDRLRQLNVSQEGIQLPTIVVVGDQSSGKSSVLESLAGISLPRGQGICTRVPLVMRLQNGDEAKLQIEYGSGRVVTVASEAEVAVAIDEATAEIAGSGKGISDAPITLVVQKRGVPDLTLVDLPGITRVPVQGQPEDIYDQIARIIKAYIAPKESIILNVLSATVDFPTCESIRMSQQVDRTGERTLAVVTKADKNPEGLLEKVTMDDVHIGLGYVCVRNRIGDETYDEARAAERRLFEEHPLLSLIDRSMVGIPTLASRLTQIQAGIIARCLPDIVKQINDKLSRSSDELSQMPPDLSTVADAVREFYHIVKQVRASLEKLLVRGEFDEYPDDHHRHGTARIAEMLDCYASKLPAHCPARDGEPFLAEEMRVLEETKGIVLPNFLPRSALLVLLKKKVESIVHVPHDLVSQVWDYVEELVMGILQHHSRSYPQVQTSCRRAVQSLMDKARARSAQHVNELIDMELVADYTANPDYTMKWNDMMTEGHGTFLQAVEDHSNPAVVTIPGFGETDVSHLRLQQKLAGQAFDLKARLDAYWSCVVLRLVDGLALHVLYSVKRLVEKDLEDEVAAQVLGSNMDGVERMLVPTTATAAKRDRLRKSISLLRECRELVANTMDKINAESNDRV
ncbi:dynamin-related protein 4C-like [Phragmites australis]|uniref:dynamin-related protein 4C-like n=1 Tax=Phragmites australis TaxID=29695 RepID=UPI002D794811|nr:dynamin-related protein 4C-like [Phragmites australis]